MLWTEKIGMDSVPDGLVFMFACFSMTDAHEGHTKYFMFQAQTCFFDLDLGITNLSLNIVDEK